MPMEGNQRASRDAEVKRMMMAGEKGNERGEQKLTTVNEEVEGSDSASKAQDPSKAKGELDDADYADSAEGSDYGSTKDVVRGLFLVFGTKN